MAVAWTFGRKLGAGFAAAALVLLAVAATGYRTTLDLIENAGLVAHTHEVRRELATLYQAVVEAETGSRGFVITGDDAFLEPYESAAVRAARQVSTLRRLTADNPAQQARLLRIEPVIKAKLEHARQTIAERRANQLPRATALIVAGTGKQLMTEIRDILAELDGAEAALLVTRKHDAEASAAGARSAILWGSLSGCVAVALLGLMLSRSLASQISSSVRHIQSSSTELQAAANQQATGSKEQSTAMTEITTTISELLATAKQIAESSRRVASIAEETATSARTGDQTVRRTNESIASIQRQVDVIVSHMLELGKKSQQIGSILELINELAEQTNILAINATIEAAGAGDAGRRFAVVAEEIRRLADRVGGSTKEIRELIEDVRSTVNKTVMATEGGNKAVEAGARLFAEVTAAFAQIASKVVITTEAAREIELSTKQQSTAVEQVNVAIGSVAQASRETEASSTQTLQTASQLANLSRELLRVVQARAA